MLTLSLRRHFFHHNVVQLLGCLEHEWEVFLSFDLHAQKLSYGITPSGVDWRSLQSDMLLRSDSLALVLTRGPLVAYF